MGELWASWGVIQQDMWWMEETGRDVWWMEEENHNHRLRLGSGTFNFQSRAVAVRISVVVNDARAHCLSFGFRMTP
jgi:hypothetical protein